MVSRYTQSYVYLGFVVELICHLCILLSESGEAGSIHYDDKAIDNLLDRNREGLEEKAMLANEYLASFKVRGMVLLSFLREVTLSS